MTAKIRKAVIPAAGLATRFLPATKAVPKELLPLVDKPVIQYAVEEGIEAGIEEFIFISSHRKPAVEAHFQPSKVHGDRIPNDCNLSGGALRVVYQDEARGLGHAVLCARELVGNEAFAVMLPDDLILNSIGAIKQMMDFYKDHSGSNVIAAVKVPSSSTHMYGIIDGKLKDRVSRVSALVEKPPAGKAPSNLAIMGRYILQPEIFDVLEKRAQDKTRAGEIQLTDAIAAMIGHQDIFGFMVEGKRYDCGHCVGWLEANIAYALQRDDMKEAVLQQIGQLLSETQMSQVKVLPRAYLSDK